MMFRAAGSSATRAGVREAVLHCEGALGRPAARFPSTWGQRHATNTPAQARSHPPHPQTSTATPASPQPKQHQPQHQQRPHPPPPANSSRPIPPQPPPPEDEPTTLSHLSHQLKQLQLSLPSPARSPLVDTTLTALVGLLAVVVGGGLYVTWYKHNVLYKIEQAFAPGYDPALELASPTPTPSSSSSSSQIERREQPLITSILSGLSTGHYYLLLGPKGTGKSSLILHAMRLTQAEGAAVCEVHPDLEVFRVRLGRAVNYDYNEDAQFGLFQRREPKEGGPALDIERALNKLEKVALSLSRKRHKPLVLVFNNLHQLHNDDAGRALVRLLQQKAEQWAESGVLTMVFCSDDFWPYEVLRKTANRLQVVSISDLSQKESVQTLRYMREGAGLPERPGEELRQAVDLTGGRLATLHRIGHAADVLGAAKQTLAQEKAWLLSQIGLIPDHDDDVMDEQKWASSAWLLLQEFVRLQREQERERPDGLGEGEQGEGLPRVPYWRCRQIMTRGDFLEQLDHQNIISIDINHDVRPDSLLILQAAREVVDEPGFQAALDNVLRRVDAIESLHRTREIVVKKPSDWGWW